MRAGLEYVRTQAGESVHGIPRGLTKSMRLRAPASTARLYSLFAPANLNQGSGQQPVLVDERYEVSAGLAAEHQVYHQWCRCASRISSSISAFVRGLGFWGGSIGGAMLDADGPT